MTMAKKKATKSTPIHDLPEFEWMTIDDVRAMKAAREKGDLEAEERILEPLRLKMGSGEPSPFEVEEESVLSPTEEKLLDDALAAIEALNAAGTALGVTKREANELAYVDRYADIGKTPAIDAVQPGKRIISEERMEALRVAVREAKTDRERFAEVVYWLCVIGAGIAKGAA